MLHHQDVHQVPEEDDPEHGEGEQGPEEQGHQAEHGEGAQVGEGLQELDRDRQGAGLPEQCEAVERGEHESPEQQAERILAAHSQVTSGGELSLLPGLTRRISPYPEAVARLLGEASVDRRLLTQQRRDGTLQRLAGMRQRLRLLAPGRGWNLVITLALVAAVTSAVFITTLPLLFLAYPPLLLVAVRHGFAGVGLGVVTMALVAAGATALGHGPFAYHGLDTDDRIALLQVLIAGACLMTIPACLAMVERDRFAARLAESERRYRMLADTRTT